MKKILLFAAMLIVMAVSGCQTKPDAEVMRELDGTWVCEESEYEDGAKITVKGTTTYYADNGTFETIYKMRGYAFGESMSLGSFSISGTFVANREVIYQDWNDSDVSIDLDDDMLEEMGGRKGLIKELNECKGEIKIVKLTDSELVTKDSDGEETSYTRL